MILPDVNVLIYAFRPDVPQYQVCRRWLERVVLGDEPFALSTLALGAVVRIVTHGGRYGVPATIERTFAYCDNLLSQPHCHRVEPGPRHWEIFSRLCRETGTRGATTTDAWYAALAIESGCEWITMDRDFARFPGLRWRTPDA
jgi:toxin-antitoxin system PIN domain toxin